MLKLDPKLDASELEATNQAIEMARNEYEFLRTTAYARNPSIRRSAGTANRVSERDLLNLLKRRDEAFASFFKTPDRMFLFISRLINGKPRVDVVTLDATNTDIASAVGDMRERIANRDLDFKPSAKKLYRMILGKTGTLLSGVTKATKEMRVVV